MRTQPPLALQPFYSRPIQPCTVQWVTAALAGWSVGPDVCKSGERLAALAQSYPEKSNIFCNFCENIAKTLQKPESHFLLLASRVEFPWVTESQQRHDIPFRFVSVLQCWVYFTNYSRYYQSMFPQCFFGVIFPRTNWFKNIPQNTARR